MTNKGLARARQLATSIDKADVLLLIGLGLLSSGLWQVSTAAALAVPGALLVWLALPSRPPFLNGGR